ncbi:hypothetical protein CVIRNUC_005947 [Coccomyxa viridis]|uniref:RNA-binding S4 domain-containing protein n=1 Tax=Coccomyxa viridis TaxID=1274662 RepID=A0AAV1I7P1_9CHLO|nr:hypothetical protein CVIRNUC_005947 [Coccomyxa viridis]
MPGYRPSIVRLREHFHRSITSKPSIRSGVQGYAGRDTLLNGVPSEYKEDVARVIEQAERAAETSWTTIHTDFYTPPVVSHAMARIQQLASVKGVPFGGYTQAERQRVILGQPELVEALELDPSQEGCVAALSVKGNFMFDAVTHRDFLGSICGTGIDRGKVGDIIILGETGAQILVAAELVEHFEGSLTQVRRVPVSTRQMDLSELTVKAPKTEQVRTVEASLRLDAIASAGFRVSRAKASDLVKHGDVRVNWREAKASSLVKTGDVISCAGKGRIQIDSMSLTAKGRHAIELTRYV